MDTLGLNYQAVLESSSLRMPNIAFINPTLYTRP